MSLLCAICGKPTHGGFYGNRYVTPSTHPHPTHTDAELAETKLAVDLAAKVLTVDVLLWMAREAAAA